MASLKHALKKTRPRLVPLMIYVALATVGLGLAALAVQAPLRQFLAQNDRIEEVRGEISSLEDENEALEKRIDELGEDTTLERIAREELGLVRPGEEAYVLVPPGSLTPAEPAPESAPPPTPDEDVAPGE